MEYRIKIIQKYGGEELFIPQYRTSDWRLKLACKIIFFPFLLLWIGKYIFSAPIKEFFRTWNDIEFTKSCFREINTFFNNNPIAVCACKEDAEEIIKTHKQKEVEKITKKQQEKYTAEMNKTKKNSYLKIKS